MAKPVARVLKKLSNFYEKSLDARYPALTPNIFIEIRDFPHDSRRNISHAVNRSMKRIRKILVTVTRRRITYLEPGAPAGPPQLEPATIDVTPEPQPAQPSEAASSDQKALPPPPDSAS